MSDKTIRALWDIDHDGRRIAPGETIGLPEERRSASDRGRRGGGGGTIPGQGARQAEQGVIYAASAEARAAGE